MRTSQDTPTADDDNNHNNDAITKTIEEIIPDDISREKDADVLIDEDDPKTCLNCGFRMIELKACMLQCPNCGSIKDCSEKGIW